MSYFLLLLALYALKLLLSHLKTITPQIAPASEPTEIEKQLTELEHKYAFFQSTKLRNLAATIYQLRIPAMQLQQYALSDPYTIELHLKQMKNRLKAKAIYYYLFAHRQKDLKPLSDDELKQLSPFLKLLVSLQTRFAQALQGHESLKLRAFFNQLSNPERILLNLVDIELAGFDLRDTNLSALNLMRIKFIRCHLNQANFERALFSANEVLSCDLRQAQIATTHFHGEKLLLRENRLCQDVFKRLVMSGHQDFARNYFHGTFRGTNFSNLDLQRAVFVEGDFTNTTFALTNISQTQFKTPMLKADFSEAQFSANQCMALIEKTITRYLRCSNPVFNNKALALMNEYHSLLQTIYQNRYNPMSLTLEVWRNYITTYQHQLLHALLGSDKLPMQAKVPERAIKLADSAITVANKVGTLFSRAKQKLHPGKTDHTQAQSLSR